MTQRVYECLTGNRYIKENFPSVSSRNNNVVSIKVCENTQSRKNRLYVYDYGSNQWTYGFHSYDNRGIIFYSPSTQRYEFSGVAVSTYNVLRTGTKTKRIPISKNIRWDKRLQKGIINENLVCNDLNSVNTENFYIHHLENSGQFSGGSDIVISLLPIEERENPYDTVMYGICAIEVLGVKKRSKKDSSLSFTYHKFIDFQKWRSELVEHDILPVIAWTYEGESWFVVLTDNALYDGFYIGKNKLRHQQTNYSLVRKLDDYKMNPSQLFYCIRCHLKTVRVIDEIKKNRPIPCGVGNLRYLYSVGYQKTSTFEYDAVIEKIRKYMFETVGNNEIQSMED